MRTIHATCKTTKYPDGRQDVTVNVPMIKLKEQMEPLEFAAFKQGYIDRKFARLKKAMFADRSLTGAQQARLWSEFTDAVGNDEYQQDPDALAAARAKAKAIAEQYGLILKG